MLCGQKTTPFPFTYNRLWECRSLWNWLDLRRYLLTLRYARSDLILIKMRVCGQKCWMNEFFQNSRRICQFFTYILDAKLNHLCLLSGHWFNHRLTWPKQKKLDGQGRARREAARRRKSEWKVNLGIRNSTRSNGSWWMSPKRTTWYMRQLTVYEQFGCINMPAVTFSFVDQSSSRGLQLIDVYTLNFKPNFKFSRLNFFGGPPAHWGVR